MDIKGIYNQVKSGGFQNPLNPALSKALLKITPPSLEQFTILAQAQATANGLPMPTEGQLSSAITSMGAAANNILAMQTHSDILSGVNTSSGMTVTSIARLANAAKMIEQTPGCTFPQAVMGTLVKATEIINETNQAILDVDTYLTNIPLWVEQIPTRVEDYGNKLAQQVVSDTEAVAMAKTAVINNSIASSLVEVTEDDCMSEIFASIMTQPLKDEVSKVATELRNKKLISISG